jgi:hypothetical protein
MADWIEVGARVEPVDAAVAMLVLAGSQKMVAMLAKFD